MKALVRGGDRGRSLGVSFDAICATSTGMPAAPTTSPPTLRSSRSQAGRQGWGVGHSVGRLTGSLAHK